MVFYINCLQLLQFSLKFNDFYNYVMAFLIFSGGSRTFSNTAMTKNESTENSIINVCQINVFKIQSNLY